MKNRGFTLLELLVAMAIIAVLSALIFSVVGKARSSGALAREVNAGRQLVTAYLTAANDRGGEFLVGYSASESALDDLGKEVPNPACGRYPWRLAPYLGYRLRGTILVNDQESIAKLPDHADFVYRASANPSFGMNATYVGGNQRTGMMPSPATIRRYGEFVTTRLGQAAQPAKLMVFASSRFSGDPGAGDPHQADPQPGFHLLKPPRTVRVEWQGRYNQEVPAEKFGFLDLRHNGRAVCAMLGGNIELLDDLQLQDMRYWSTQAAEADDADYLLKPIQ